MRVIGMSVVADWLRRSSDRLEEAGLVSWVAEAKAARWSGRADLGMAFPAAIFRGDEIIFPIASIGRAVVTRVDYRASILLITDVEWLDSTSGSTSSGMHP